MSQDPMLALTLWPEWAWAIAHFGKDIENRTWPPPARILGKRLAVHAGKHIGGKPGDNALLEGLTKLREMAECVADERGDRRRAGGLPMYSDLLPQITTSAIVAVVKVTGDIRGTEAGWYNGLPNYGWKLTDLITLPKPVPCKGAQGLWELPPDVLAKVREQLGITKPVQP